MLPGARPESGRALVFNAGAVAHLAQHFQVVARALLQTLRFQKLAFRLEFGQGVLSSSCSMLAIAVSRYSGSVT